MSVEPVGEGGLVPECVLRDGRGMVGPTETGLQIAEDGFDPLELRQVFVLAATDDGGLVVAARAGDVAEAGETVGVYRAARC